MQQRLEQLLALALRAEIEVGGGIRQRQQLGQQRDFVIAARTGREQLPQLAELLLDRVVAREPGGAFELDDERVERAVLMVRRAEIAQPRVRLALDALRQRRGQARLADARLARDQHHPPLAGLRLLPAPQQQIELLVAPDERRRLRAQRLEAAQDAAFADHAPGALRLGKAGERLRPEILEFEQRADLPPRALGDDERARSRPAPAAGRRGSASRRRPRAPAPRPRRSDRRPRRARWRCRAARSAACRMPAVGRPRR